MPSPDETGLVAASRRTVVAEMLAGFDQASESAGTPTLHLLTAPIGWGKTAIVLDFYRALAQRQTPPADWPTEIAPHGELATRKTVRPTGFTVPPNAQLPWMWWGVNCDTHSDGTPVAALNLGGDQLFVHSVALELARKSSADRTLRSLGLSTGDDAYSSGGAVLGVLSLFGMTVFPPLAIGQVAYDSARRAWHHARSAREALERRRAAQGEREIGAGQQGRGDGAAATQSPPPGCLLLARLGRRQVLVPTTRTPLTAG